MVLNYSYALGSVSSLFTRKVIGVPSESPFGLIPERTLI